MPRMKNVRTIAPHVGGFRRRPWPPFLVVCGGDSNLSTHGHQTQVICPWLGLRPGPRRPTALRLDGSSQRRISRTIEL